MNNERKDILHDRECKDSSYQDVLFLRRGNDAFKLSLKYLKRMS